MNKVKSKFDRFTDGLDDKLERILIYTNDSGQHILFERYSITKSGHLSMVDRLCDGYTLEFSDKRTAAAWCILDHHNKIVEARRVVELDKKIGSLNAEISIHKRLTERHPLEWGEIQRDKLLEASARSRRFKWELDKYIILAKNCQERGYKNEFTRIA